MILLALIGFAVVVYLFIYFIIKRDRGHKEPPGALWAAFGFGILSIVLAMIFNGIFIPEEVGGTDELANAVYPTGSLLFYGLSIGLIEETAKAIPLALFLYKKRYFDELTDGIIYFGIVGITFGIVEDLLYSLQYGGGVGIFRILISPYLHVGFTILFGTCLIYKKYFNKSWLIPLAGLLLAIVFHGLYDFFLFTQNPIAIVGSLVITVGLNVAVFVLFRKMQKIDEKHGKSATGINKFCRSCGRPNPKRFLYCPFCGKHT